MNTQYSDYLKSAHWLQLKESLFKQLGKRCFACRSFYEIDVHHLRYRELYNVLRGDLIPLCHDCHQIAHWLFDKGVLSRETTREEAKQAINMHRVPVSWASAYSLSGDKPAAW